MINSYQDNYFRHYFVKGWSGAHLLCLLSVYLIIALPFYFSFAGKNFWQDTKQRPITTTYNYTGYYAIQVNYLSGTAFVTHQYSNIPGNAMTYPGSSFDASLSVQDLSSTDSVTLSLTTAYNAVEVLSVNVVMYYQVAFQELGKIQLTGMMWSVQGNFQRADFAGSISYKGNTPISAILFSQYVNLPPYYPNAVGGFTFKTLADQLTLDSLLLDSSLSSQIYTPSTITTARTVYLDYSKRRSVVVNYYPSILQTLKFKYSTYLAFAIISFFIFNGLYKAYIKEGLIECQSFTERVSL